MVNWYFFNVKIVHGMANISIEGLIVCPQHEGIIKMFVCMEEVVIG